MKHLENLMFGAATSMFTLIIVAILIAVKNTSTMTIEAFAAVLTVLGFILLVGGAIFITNFLELKKKINRIQNRYTIEIDSIQTTD